MSRFNSPKPLFKISWFWMWRLMTPGPRESRSTKTNPSHSKINKDDDLVSIIFHSLILLEIKNISDELTNSNSSNSVSNRFAKGTFSLDKNHSTRLRNLSQTMSLILARYLNQEWKTFKIFLCIFRNIVQTRVTNNLKQ